MRKSTRILGYALLLLLSLSVVFSAQAEEIPYSQHQGAPTWLKELLSGETSDLAKGLPGYAESVLGETLAAEVPLVLSSPMSWTAETAQPSAPRKSISQLVAEYTRLVEQFLKANNVDMQGPFRLNKLISYESYEHFTSTFPSDVPNLASTMGKTEYQMLVDGIALIRSTLP